MSCYRGVVQLFNAVKKQQKLVEDKLDDVGKSEYKKDKVMQSMTKGKFMDVLKGTSSTRGGGSTDGRVKAEVRLCNGIQFI